MKENVDPKKLQIGIERFKALNGSKILVSFKHKQDLEIFSIVVNEQLNEELSIEPSRKFLPQIIIFNIPEDIGTETAEIIVKSLNRNEIKNGMFKVKFISVSKNKKSRFMVAEVSPELEKYFLKKE